MLSVSVSLTPDGCLERLEARGHMAGGPAGANLACAAATALLRTAAEVLHGRAGVRCTGDSPAEGALTLIVSEVETASAEWTRGVTDFLVEGCRRLQGESAGQLVMQVQRRG